jgi:hypothetical protein
VRLTISLGGIQQKFKEENMKTTLCRNQHFIWIAIVWALHCVGYGQHNALGINVRGQSIQPLQTVSPATLVATPSHFQNVILYPNGIQDQTDVSIAVSPKDNTQLMIGSNAYFFLNGNNYAAAREGYFYSNDEAGTWRGTNALPGTPSWANDSIRDYPRVAFDRNGYGAGYRYYSFVNMDDLNRRVNVANNQRGDVNGWSTPVSVPTNNDTLWAADDFMTTDFNNSSQYKNNIYVAWTDFVFGNSGPILFSASTNGGGTFADTIRLSGNGNYFYASGANLAVGLQGQIYATWSYFGGYSGHEDSIGFNSSTNGGVSWDNLRTLRIPGFSGINGYYQKGPNGVSNQVLLSTSPVLDIDRSNGSFGGSIYLVWANASDTINHNKPDIMLMGSRDGGSSWFGPVRVNNDTAQSQTDQWNPWINIDPCGGVNVVFYDSRIDPVSNYLTQVYLARSTDGGQHFANYQISDTAFTPTQSLGWYGGYMGDYIGVTSTSNYVIPCWADNRRGYYKAFAAKVGIFPVASTVTDQWNMISVPIVPYSFAKNDIWPTSNSSASTYNFGNYVPEDTVLNGIGYWLRFPQAANLLYMGAPLVSEQIWVNPGWNMIGSLSFPLPTSKIWPSVDTMIHWPCFGYLNGYYPSDTLQSGQGYWINVNQAGLLTLDTNNSPLSGNGNGGNPPCAPFAPPIPIPASPQSGTTGVSTSPTLSWNATTCATKYHLQVSSNSSFNPLTVDDSTITGTSRQVSGLSYWTEYYWRLSSINGYGSSDWSSIWYFVTMSNNPPPPCQCCANMLTDLDQLSVGDASGNSQRLYVVHGARQLNLGFKNYGLPPETPHGLFGARFGSGRFIESIPADSQSRVSLPIRVKDITFPLTIKWKLRNENALRYWLTLPGTQGRNKVALNGQTGNTSVSGTDNGILMLNVQPMMIKPCPPQQGTVERFGDIDEQKEIPTETKLFPNYPNPFNNSTTFTYQLSTPGIVQMKVYNLLGEEIARLVDNESKDAGYYSATWNADNMASGIYYVRMIITDKTDKQVYQNVNKLILLK